MTDPRQTTPADPPEPVEATVADSTARAEEARALRLVAGYVIEGELGRGGMGVVYRARQLSLNRHVALKMILHADHVSEAQRQRFVHEAEALGRLHHPNIVQVHEAGLHEGTPFYSMELVAGGSLNQHLRGTPLTPRDAAALLDVLARAVHHAHLAGIIHRDLKPANVLLGGTGKEEQGSGFEKTDPASAPVARPSSLLPKITDFGLAKEMGTEGQTQSGAVLGTPSYMAPEQAAGKVHAVGVHTDVYALGAILYECLTGRPPFRAAGPAETMRLVLEQEPVSPRSLQPGVPRDLDTICLRCLQKEPEKRYDSALALAEDVKRFLDGEPIRARPISSAARAARWLRKRPLVAGLLALVLLVTGIGIGGFIWAFGEALAESNRAVGEAANARKAEKDATIEKGRAERGFINSRITLADAAWRDGNVLIAHARLDEVPAPVRSWDWHYLKRTCNGGLFTLHGHQNMTLNVAFCLEGRYLASSSPDGTVKIWDARDGRELRTFDGGPHGTGALSFIPGGRLLGAGLDGKVRIWDAATGQLLRTLPVDNRYTRSISASVDGKRLAATTLAGPIKIFDPSTGQELRALEGHADSVNNVSLNRDGTRLLSGGNDGTLRFWDVRTGQEMLRLGKQSNSISSAALSPDGSRAAASCSGDPVIRVWDTYLGRELLVLHGHTLHVNALAFSPDGQRLASAGSDGLIRVWDAVDGREILVLRGHINVVFAVAFSHDGQRIASSGWDQFIKIWDARDSSAVSVFRNTPALGTALAFSPDGQRLATANGTVLHVRGIESKQKLLAITSPAVFTRALAFSPDGEILAAAEQGGMIRLWDAQTGKQCHVFRGHEGRASSVAFAAPGTLATAGADGLVRLWELPAGRELRVLRGHRGAVNGIAVLNDGKRLVSAGEDGTVRLWDLESGDELLVLKGHHSGVNSAAISADGLRIASAGADHLIKVWDVESGKELHSMAGHTGTISRVVFHPEHYRLASGSEDRTVRVWDALGGVELLSLPGHINGVEGVAFSGDGNWLASMDASGMARLWDGRPGPERAVLVGHVGAVGCVVFSPDSSLLATGGDDAIVRLWDTRTGKALHSLTGLPSPVARLAFAADGRTVLARAGGVVGCGWDCQTGQPLPKGPGDLEIAWRPLSPDSRLLAIPYGSVIRLFALQDTEAEKRCRQGQTALDTAWHDAEVNRHEHAGRWHAAVTHLEHLLKVRANDAGLHIRRAQLLVRLKRNDEAMREVWRAMLLEPGARVNVIAPPPAMPPAAEDR
jgi:WD40 repeat protein